MLPLIEQFDPEQQKIGQIRPTEFRSNNRRPSDVLGASRPAASSTLK